MIYDLKTIENEILNKILRLRKIIVSYHRNNFSNYHDKIKDDKVLCLGSRQFDIMYNIIKNDCVTVTSLSNKLYLSTSSLSIIISKMSSKNLLEKVYDENKDGRKIILKPTKLGYDSYNFIEKSSVNHFLKFCERLNSTDINIYIKALHNFTIALKDYGVKEITEDCSKEEIADLIFHNLLVLKIPFETFLKTANLSLNLTRKEFEILANMDEFDIHTPSQLSNTLYSSESTISTQLKSLVKKSYLRKEKGHEDTRKTFFYITDEGEKVFKETRSICDKQLLNFISSLDEEQKKNILMGIDYLFILFELLSKHN